MWEHWSDEGIGQALPHAGMTHLHTTAGPRAVLGSQRIGMNWQGGSNLSVRPCGELLRGEDGSRSVPYGQSTPLAAVSGFSCTVPLLYHSIFPHAHIFTSSSLKFSKACTNSTVKRAAAAPSITRWS